MDLVGRILQTARRNSVSAFRRRDVWLAESTANSTRPQTSQQRRQLLSGQQQRLQSKTRNHNVQTE